MLKNKTIEWIENENGCYICTSHAKDKLGRARYKKQGIKSTVHKHVFEEMYGFVPNGMVIRHKCDEYGCINPEHMEIGTQSDNMKDMYERGRGCNCKKLNDEQIKEIRESKLSSRKLAKLYNVSKTTILNYKMEEC